MKLDVITARLEGLEETIITKLIDRAQYKYNEIVYKPGKSGFNGEKKMSLFEIRLTMQEEMDAQFGRYRQPEERPFSENFPKPKRIVHLTPSQLAIDDFNKVNLTANIMTSYLDFIPKICLPGDDNQYGSTVVMDVYALQAIAERIHFGSFYIAECKFRLYPDEYTKLIQQKNTEELISLLTRKEVEEKIIDRVQEKVAYAQTRVNPLVRNLLDPDIVIHYYRDTIIPLTKKGEILYLLNRII